MRSAVEFLPSPALRTRIRKGYVGNQRMLRVFDRLRDLGEKSSTSPAETTLPNCPYVLVEKEDGPTATEEH